MIYFIGNGEGFVKIGFSRNPQARLKTLQTSSPTNLEILAVIPGDQKAERQYHEKYSDLQENGEWYRIDGELEEEIYKLRNTYEIEQKPSPTFPSVKLIPGRDDDLIEWVNELHKENSNVSAQIRQGAREYLKRELSAKQRLARLKKILEDIYLYRTLRGKSIDTPNRGGL